jgi:hypothetical protein
VITVAKGEDAVPKPAEAKLVADARGIGLNVCKLAVTYKRDRGMM